MCDVLSYCAKAYLIKAYNHTIYLNQFLQILYLNI